MHGPGLPPSDWVQRWAPLVRTGGSVLDMACGSGRHLRWLAGQGFVVTGVDRDEAAVAPLRALGEIVVADLEGAPWPLPGRRFDALTGVWWNADTERCQRNAKLLASLLAGIGPGVGTGAQSMMNMQR